MPPELWKRAGFALYLHWPFCQAKCPYCDFNSHVSLEINQDRWADAYCSEIKRAAVETKGRVLSSVFFGGGTPSLMTPETVARILECVRQSWPMSNDPEITLEANPTSVEAKRFQGFRDAGVTRISMGIQALNNDDLKRLGRLHTVEEARSAFETARSLFDRVSFDLIYARQGQSLNAWTDELKQALSMAVDHLSLYQLTVEPGTAFAERFKKGSLKGLPDEDLAADLYMATQEICTSFGLPAYEVSNHAYPGAESRHNLVYWQCGDYVGIGPGAHGRLTLNDLRLATETELLPAKWLKSVEEFGSGETVRSQISEVEQVEEYGLMGLRLTAGVDKAILALHPNFTKNINYLYDNELLQTAEGVVSATEKGRPLLNAILRQLFT